MSDYCYCDYEPCEFYHQETRRARKPHECDECGKSINPGEQYEHVRAKYDGDVSTCRTCCRCLAIRAYVKAHVPCFCWYHGNLLEEARETIAEVRHEVPGMGMEFGRLYVAMKRGTRLG